jgi:hypothetical protein
LSHFVADPAGHLECGFLRVDGAIAQVGFVKLLRNRKQKSKGMKEKTVKPYCATLSFCKATIWIGEFVFTAGPEPSEKHEDKHDEPQSLSIMNSRSL